jgi:hypothetical protein
VPQRHCACGAGKRLRGERKARRVNGDIRNSDFVDQTAEVFAVEIPGPSQSENSTAVRRAVCLKLNTSEDAVYEKRSSATAIAADRNVVPSSYLGSYSGALYGIVARLIKSELVTWPGAIAVTPVDVDERHHLAGVTGRIGQNNLVVA